MTFLVSGLVTFSLMAQKMNVVKTDLFSPIIRTYVIKYERVLSEDMSAQLGFFYTGYKPGGTDSELSGWGLTPEFRYYLSKTPAPNGLYIAPNFRYYSFKVEDKVADASGTLTNASIALNIGGQLLLKDIIVMDFWIGPSYNFRNLSAEGGDINVGISDANGFGARAGFSIGVAF